MHKAKASIRPIFRLAPKESFFKVQLYSLVFCFSFAFMLWPKDIVHFFRQGLSPRMTLDYTWELRNKRFAALLWVLSSSPEKVRPREAEGVF